VTVNDISLIGSIFALAIDMKKTIQDLRYGLRLLVKSPFFAFTAILSFGLIPALHAMRADLTSALRDQENFKFKAFRFLGARNLLVVMNIASCLAVLIITGLIVQHVEKNSRAELPLNPDTLLQIPLSLNPEEYTAEHARQLNLNLQTRLQSIPQIHCASLASADSQQTMSAPEHESVRAAIALIDRDYFKSINNQFVRGRYFFTSEFQSNGDAVVVNEALAQLYWPQQEALSRQLIRHSMGG
jgi:putative ABC transport system permease protein